jgi:esterase/lipase superfamily enzyme
MQTLPRFASLFTAACRRRATLVLLLAAAVLAGCQSPVRLMPTPVAFRTGAVDPFEKAGSTAKGTDVPVFYVTNRGAVIEYPTPIYTILPSERLRMGVAHVRIGDGTLDWETLHRLSTSDDPDQRPVVELDKLDPLATLQPGQTVQQSPDARAFLQLVDRALEASASQEIVIYVHGANNTVARAAAQAAQLRHFTGRRVVVLAFMWPSAGSILRYLTDVTNAEASIDPFVKLVEMLGANTRATAIDVIAYSAGAQVASPALARLGAGQPGESRDALRARLRVRNVYFAAPDIDTRRFVDEMRVYKDVVSRVTLSVNLNDSALRFAQFVHRASRAGRPDPTELSEEQTAFLVEAAERVSFDLVNVDPYDIPGLPVRSHAFWYEDPSVSADLLGLLLLNAAPPRRGLDEEASPRGLKYWRFPPDYAERVKRLFIAPAPAGGGPAK